jgi:hypothetical protein
LAFVFGNARSRRCPGAGAECRRHFPSLGEPRPADGASNRPRRQPSAPLGSDG